MPAIILSIIAVVLFITNVFVARPTTTVQTRVEQKSFGDLVPPTQTPTNSPTPTLTPSPAPTATPKPRDPGLDTIECVGPDGVHFQTQRNACDDLNNFWKNPNTSPVPTSGFRREKVDEHTTVMWLPPDDRMSTNDELFSAINTYRRGHGIGEVARSDTLCGIAQKRADEQLALGKIDGHAGFAKFAQDQRDFSYLTEVLFGGAQPQSGVHIVEFGWDQSLTGHKEAIQDRTMSHGCGGVAGYFAAFIFGTE
ncbi:MAG: hypothetical protein AAB557_05600 [Patescibacteria group bacterium]